MVELIDELLQTPNRLSARDKEHEEEQTEKFKKCSFQVRQGSFGGNIQTYSQAERFN